jgi:hypothetical protein
VSFNTRVCVLKDTTCPPHPNADIFFLGTGSARWVSFRTGVHECVDYELYVRLRDWNHSRGRWQVKWFKILWCLTPCSPLPCLAHTCFTRSGAGLVFRTTVTPHPIYPTTPHAPAWSTRHTDTDTAQHMTHAHTCTACTNYIACCLVK